MAEGAGPGPAARVPERLDRRARLGPFPSARDAARFLCYAAAGALVAPWVSPFLWIPIVGGGFAVSVWQPDGRPVDERAWIYVRWRLRSLYRGEAVGARRSEVNRVSFLELAPGAHLAVVRAAGAPLTYLAPADLDRKFRRFRDLLRTLSGEFVLFATTVPVRPEPVLPSEPASVGPDPDPRAGYVELVRLLCRRRRSRRVYLALRSRETGPDALSRLDAEANALAERLGELGLRAGRLADRELVEAGYRFDWMRDGGEG